MRNGIELNGSFQRFVDVFCYIDIPISWLLNVIGNKENTNIIDLLIDRSPVVKDWNETLSSTQNLYNFLVEHSTTVRNYIRIAITKIDGLYAKTPDDEFLGIDEDYIEMYNSFCDHYKLERINAILNSDINLISSNVTRPHLKSPQYPKENLKAMFMQTSFQLRT
jgi:hypothetical protein